MLHEIAFVYSTKKSKGKNSKKESKGSDAAVEDSEQEAAAISEGVNGDDTKSDAEENIDNAAKTDDVDEEPVQRKRNRIIESDEDE